MLIKCPQCHAVYDLPDNLIKKGGLKMRCAECAEIWTAYRRDAITKSKAGTSGDIKKMFERVSKNTQDLFDEKEIKPIEKVRVVNVTHHKHSINILLALLALFLIVASLYYMRYDVVRFVPQTEALYRKLKIDSIPYGRNLEFQNITTRDFTDDNMAKIEIKGTIVNTGKYATDIPQIKVDIYDKSGKLLLNITHNLPIPRLEAGYNLLFNVSITNPTPFGKSIYLTFTDNL